MKTQEKKLLIRSIYSKNSGSGYWSKDCRTVLMMIDRLINPVKYLLLMIM